MGNTKTQQSSTWQQKKLDTLLYLLTGSAMLFCSILFLSWLRF